MVGPVPGIAPNRVPMRVPRTIGANDCLSSFQVGNMSRRRTFMPLPINCMRFTLRRKSATPKRPSASATSSTLSVSSTRPNVKRATPLFTSVPTMPISRPTTVIATPFSGEPRDIVPPAMSPSSMIENISPGPNLKAISTSSGEAKIITVMPKEAAKNEQIIVMPSARPPLPCLVIG